MSKIQKIETALVGINGARFQDLCNAYFFWKGYNFITSTGSVIGKEKTRKGTPDSYIPIKDDEYIFIEYTTKDRLGKAKGFYEKLSSDIDHCFDERKNKIKNSQISKVILCFTQKLKVDEHDSLRKKCAAHGAKFEPHGIDQLSKAILLYPSLGRDFLDIPIDTQQILTPANFIKEYEKGKLATGLSNKLYFREDEITNALSYFQNCDLLIIGGNAGIGKSRLALEILKQFCSSNPTYTPVCIDNKGCPIYEDVRIYLQSTKDYILLIDDANRATKHFEFLINLLKEEREGSIKIVATVRDYAVSIIEDASKNFNYKKVKVNPLTDKQIREILQSDDFKIMNRAYSDTIVRVAQGNPRLAIMAAKIALEKQNLSAFNEIPKIYDSYYDGVVKEIDELDDITFLKVLGIISFFKTIGKEYRNNEEIFVAFGITKSEFWEKVIILHNMELVDLFDNEVVKISDQILGTYFFYKTFIRDGILDFSVLITKFYGRQNKRFKDTIFPVTNTFGFEHIKEKINKHLDITWEHFREDELALIKLFSLFWIFQQEKILSYIGKQIVNLPQQLTKSLVFEKDKNNFVSDTNDKDYFSVLKQFLKYSSSSFPLAVDLIFLYIEKQPSYLAEFVHHIKNVLTFDNYDYQTGFYRQATFFDKLISLIQSSENKEIYRGIFYHIINTFLETAFQKSDGVDRDNTFTMYTYPLPNIPPILEFRNKIWEFLFDDFAEYRDKVTSIIGGYTTMNNLWVEKNEEHKKTFWSLDSASLLPFIEHNFDKENYKECKTAQLYFQKLDNLNIPFNKELIQVFKNYKSKLSLKLQQDFINGRYKYDLPDNIDFKKKDGSTDWKIVDSLKYDELKEFTDKYDLEDYKKLWSDLNELCEYERNRLAWSFKSSFFQILRILVNKDAKVFLDLVDYIFANNGLLDDFSLNHSNNLTVNVLKSIKNEHGRFFNIINKYEGKEYLHWKLAFFKHLSKEYVDIYYTEELLKTINKISGYFNFHNFDFLSKYQNAWSTLNLESKKNTENSESIYEVIVCILLDKNKNEGAEISFGWDFISKHSHYFDSNIENIKQIYFSNYRNDNHFDYDGKEMKIICDLTPNFIIDFMNEFCGSEYSRVGRELPIHNFKFVWDSDNYVKVIDSLIGFAKEKEMIITDWEHFANKFFVANGESQIEKKINYIKYYVDKNADNKEAIQLIFNVITYSFPNKRLEFLKLFLDLNQDAEIFEVLNFHTNGVYSGSRIPIVEGRIEFMNQVEKMLDSLPNSSAFIQHRIITKSKIESLKRDIEWEKKREFEDYFG